MVAKIKSGKSLKGAIYYNEHKVNLGKAELLDAVGYYKDATDLTFPDKLRRLKDLADRNTRTRTNTVHISLNFPNGENLGTPDLRQIAADYLAGIGFGEQPYLVYRHIDAGHPHIHLVTTNIRRDGDRISLHYLGKNESESTRKAIEVKYGLQQAEKAEKEKPQMKVAEIADYGKAETKRQITNILSYVLRQYKFTSLPELNAVLQHYHLFADGGAKGSRMQLNEGLAYWITDQKGTRMGMPVKASMIYGKPTLAALKAKFSLNEALRKSLKQPLITEVDQALSKATSLSLLQKELASRQIDLVLRYSEDGRLYGVTFVDHDRKAVFNGSDLGKKFSANQLQEHFAKDLPNTYSQRSTGELRVSSTEQHLRYGNPGQGLADALFQQEAEDLAALNQFKRKKRKGLKL